MTARRPCWPSAFTGQSVSDLAGRRELGAHLLARPDQLRAHRLYPDRVGKNFSVDSTGQFGTNGNQKVGITFPNQTLQGYSGQNISGGIFAGGNPAKRRRPDRQHL